MSNNPNYDPEYVMPDATANNSVETFINRKDELDEAVDVFDTTPFSLNICLVAGLAAVVIVGAAVLLAIYG